VLNATTHTQERKGAISVSSATCVGFSGSRRAEWPESRKTNHMTSLRYRGQLGNLVESPIPPTV
jgi:hypothetical protein